ncbi:MAG: four helix bundle suffix domain-containing protein [Chthoniobacterales bacterium]
MTSQKRLRPAGGYRRLVSFQTTTLIYDATLAFCKKFIPSHSRTTDQMIQSARSERQNIAEGNRAGATSSRSELKLTNVARASLEELLLDFEDYLRQNDLPLWEKSDRRASQVRALVRQCQRKDPSDQTDPSDLHLASPDDKGDRVRYSLYRSWLEHKDPAVRANAAICLIHQANFLLDQQLISLEQSFIREGGYREKMAAARVAQHSQKATATSASKAEQKTCPDCGSPMALRTAKSGKNPGSQFYGGLAYPTCKTTLPV